MPKTKESECNSPEKEIFKQYLTGKGLSFTRQREAILAEIFNNHTHFEAEDIVETIRKSSLRVSRSTIYRTISHLEECFLIRKIDLGHGHSHFEHTLGHQHHEHLYCEQCDSILEFSDNTLEEQLRIIAESFGFIVKNHAVQLFGICKNCNNKK